MPRLRHADILIELSELCHDIMNDIRQQLTYYRASVYKDETSNLMNSKIAQLRLVAGLFRNDLLEEPFRDYDAMAEAGVMNYVPGECSFSTRVTCLLKSLSEPLGTITRQAASQTGGSNDIQFTIKKHRRELLAMCRHGSRQWTFFHSV